MNHVVAQAKWEPEIAVLCFFAPPLYCCPDKVSQA